MVEQPWELKIPSNTFLRESMVELGIESKKGFARLLDVSPSTLFDWMGDRSIPDFETREDVYNVVFGRKVEMNKNNMKKERRNEKRMPRE